jgi:outer membrane protein assembly factor BamB
MRVDWPANLRNTGIRIVLAFAVSAITTGIVWVAMVMFIGSMAFIGAWLAIVVFGALIVLSPVIATLVLLPLIRRIGGCPLAIALCTAAGAIVTAYLIPARMGDSVVLRLVSSFLPLPWAYVFERFGIVLGSYIGTWFRSRNAPVRPQPAADFAVFALPLLVAGSWFGVQVARIPRDLQTPSEMPPAPRTLARMTTCNFATIDFAPDDRLLWTDPLGLVDSFHPDGTAAWSLPTEGRVSAATIGPDGTAYVVAGGRLLALSSDGKELWSAGLGMPANGIAVGKEAVYVTARRTSAAEKSKLIAASDGARKWEIETPSDPYGVTVSTGGVAVVPALKSMMAVAPNGTISWNRAVTPQFWGSAAAAGPGGRIYVTGHGELHALDESGLEIWHLPSPRSIVSVQPCAPTVGSDGTIYYTVGNVMFAIGADGRERWRWKTDYTLFRPAAGPDGTVYLFGALNSRTKLFAVKEGRKRWEYRSPAANCIAFAMYGAKVSADGKYLAFMDDQRLQRMTLR